MNRNPATTAMRAGGWRSWAALLPVVALCSCATQHAGYLPATVGVLAPTAPRSGLEVTICSDLVRFTARVKNVGPEPMWVPRTPAVIYAWTYPTGRRDNMLLMVPRSVAYTEETAQLLQPGQEFAQPSEIQTQYFPKAGITEFVALLQIPENSNTALPQFAASGRYTSNRYGVKIVAR